MTLHEVPVTDELRRLREKEQARIEKSISELEVALSIVKSDVKQLDQTMGYNEKMTYERIDRIKETIVETITTVKRVETKYTEMISRIEKVIKIVDSNMGTIKIIKMLSWTVTVALIGAIIKFISTGWGA